MKKSKKIYSRYLVDKIVGRSVKELSDKIDDKTYDKEFIIKLISALELVRVYAIDSLGE